MVSIPSRRVARVEIGHKPGVFRGTGGSNPVPSSEESCEHRYGRRRPADQVLRRHRRSVQAQRFSTSFTSMPTPRTRSIRPRGSLPILAARSRPSRLTLLLRRAARIPKIRCRTTVAKRMGETLSGTALYRDQVGLFKAQPGRPKRTGAALTHYIWKTRATERKVGCAGREQKSSLEASKARSWPQNPRESGECR